MRPFIIILISCLLLLSLSLCANAMGNDYTFSPAWWSYVFGAANPSQSFYSLYDADLFLSYGTDGSTVTSNSVRYYGFGQLYDSRVDSYIDLSLPVNLEIIRRSSLSLVFYLKSNNPVSDFSVTLNNSTSSVNMDVDIYPLYEMTFSGLASNANTQLTMGTDCYIVHLNYYNDLNSSITFDYLNISFNKNASSGSSLGGFLLGVLTDKANNVILPDTFYSSIDNINNRLQDVYVRVNDMRTTLNELNSTAELMKDNSDTTVEQLESIQSLITELSNKLSSSGSVSQQIYQTLTVPSSEVSQAVAQLEETVTQAKQELAQINETIKTVVLPSITDVDDVVSTDTSQSLDDALGNSDVRSTLSTVFSFGQFSSMLLIMLTIATVGYILYGKKG